MIYKEPEGLRQCVYESRDQSGCRSEEGTLWPIHTSLGKTVPLTRAFPVARSLRLLAYASDWSSVLWHTWKPVPGWEKSFTWKSQSEPKPVNVIGISVLSSNPCNPSLQFVSCDPPKLGVLQSFSKYFSVYCGPGIVLGSRDQYCFFSRNLWTRLYQIFSKVTVIC